MGRLYLHCASIPYAVVGGSAWFWDIHAASLLELKFPNESESVHPSCRGEKDKKIHTKNIKNSGEPAAANRIAVRHTYIQPLVVEGF